MIFQVEGGPNDKGTVIAFIEAESKEEAEEIWIAKHKYTELPFYIHIYEITNMAEWKRKRDMYLNVLNLD